MICDMVDVRGHHRSTFLRATSAIGLLGEPMPFDRLPSWRLVPSAPLDSGFGTAMPIPIDCQVPAMRWHGKRLRSTRSELIAWAIILNANAASPVCFSSV
jgi:hypothetical protein